MDDCIFCKIVHHTLPSSTLYEGARVIAFLDIQPVTPGHTLIASKKHYEAPLETPDEVLADIIQTAKPIATAIARAFDAQGFNITFNNGKTAGQVIPHTHLHIIPRYQGDNLHLWPQTPYPEGEQERVAEKIRNALV